MIFYIKNDFSTSKNDLKIIFTYKMETVGDLMMIDSNYRRYDEIRNDLCKTRLCKDVANIIVEDLMEKETPKLVGTYTLHYGCMYQEIRFPNGLFVKMLKRISANEYKMGIFHDPSVSRDYDRKLVDLLDDRPKKTDFASLLRRN